jgi:hypothetical protein
MFIRQGMKHVVESFVKQCGVCQQAKHELCKYPGLLQPLPVPQHSWSDISMEFIDGLPNFYGYSVILVVVDRFTKYNHFSLEASFLCCFHCPVVPRQCGHVAWSP